MDAIDESKLEHFFATVEIAVADPRLGIGRELCHRQPPRRRLVIHFGPCETQEYISRVLSIVLSVRDVWLLLPRHGPASLLRMPEITNYAEAITFGPAERDRLCTFLCERDKSIGSVSSDLYSVSQDGDVIITWDHHTAEEGLIIELRDVNSASRILTDLNNFGVELELLYTDG
jgi:hypothetical protein